MLPNCLPEPLPHTWILYYLGKYILFSMNSLNASSVNPRTQQHILGASKTFYFE